jgi:hypothetical protein
MQLFIAYYFGGNEPVEKPIFTQNSFPENPDFHRSLFLPPSLFFLVKSFMFFIQYIFLPVTGMFPVAAVCSGASCISQPIPVYLC